MISKSLILSLVALTSFPVWGESEPCGRFLTIYDDIMHQHEEFLRKYGPGTQLDQSLGASQIKEILKAQKVDFVQEGYRIIVKPINKPGLNRFAYKLERHDNIRVAFNLETFTDRDKPPKDDYFQATSDSYYVNLVLSKKFLKEITSEPDWDVDGWIDQAITYFKGYNLIRKEIVSTAIKVSGMDVDLHKMVLDHREELQTQIFNLSHGLQNDLNAYRDVAEWQTYFAAEISKLTGHIRHSMSLVERNGLWGLIQPLSRDPILKAMDIELFESKDNSYRVLVTVQVGTVWLNFFLEKELKFAERPKTLHNPHRGGFLGRSLLSKEQLEQIVSHSGHHINMLVNALRGLNASARNPGIKDLLSLRGYHMGILTHSSQSNREFIY